MRYPSWSDYATGDQSDAPHLHRNLWAAWMPVLGSTGSTLFDVGPRGYHAAANNRTNATDWVTKQFSSAYFQEANAAGRFIPPLSSSLLGQGEATISCWVWLVATPATTAAIYQDTATALTGARFGLLWTNAGNIQFQMRDPYTQRSLSPLTASVTTDTYGRWSHWCVTYSAAQATINLYRDGVSVRTASNSGDVIRSTSAYGIGIGGRISSAAAEASNDLYIADIRLWNRSLSSEEVRELGSGPGAGFRRRSMLSRVAISLGGETVTGSCAATTGAATGSASGSQSHSGTASPSTSSATGSASGSLSYSGLASATTEDASSQASGSLTHSGSAAVSTSNAVASASGSVACIGSAASVTESATCSALGGTGTFGVAGVALEPASSAASGAAVLSGTSSGTTAASGVAIGSVLLSGALSASTASSASSASGFVGFQGQASVTTSAYGLASGTVTLVAVAAIVTQDAGAQAVGQIPTSGSVSVTLGSATLVAVGSVVQTDIEISASVVSSVVPAAVAVPLVDSSVRLDNIRGRKIWL